jgi:DNA-directed RNA polymerase specialized sigma24 family protein
MEGRGDVEIDSNVANVPAASGPRRKWALTQEAFHKLLAALADDQETAGEKYLEIRNNLTKFFEWRGCPFPEDHADETINRVARRIAEGEEIRNPPGYCTGVARMLLLEVNKERARQQQALGEMASLQTAASESEGREGHIECLRACLQDLTADNRELIVEYYQGEKGTKIEIRKRLTERFGVPVNTLRMRALRLREKLQVCVENCVKNCEAQPVMNR